MDVLLSSFAAFAKLLLRVSRLRVIRVISSRVMKFPVLVKMHLFKMRRLDASPVLASVMRLMLGSYRSPKLLFQDGSMLVLRRIATIIELLCFDT